MDWNKIKVVIGREYSNRVKKKSFLITTFLVPILFAAICVLPSLIMYATKEESKKVAVIDKSGIVMPLLENTASAEYSDYSGFDVDSVKNSLADLGMDVLLYVSPLDTAGKTVTAQTYSAKPVGVDFSETIGNKVNDAVEQYRIGTYGIDGLGEIMDEVKSDVRVKEYLLDESGKETLSESGIYMIASMLLGMIIFMFISLFGASVMSSVIEEKSSRVVEVLISSVKATELMFGKIIGVALVALTQFFLWIALTGIIVAAVMGIFGKKMIGSSAADPVQMAQSMGVGQEQMDAMGMGSTIDMASAVSSDSDASGEEGTGTAVFNTLRNLPWGELILCFVIYFILGYLLYASMFAAIGSAVENEADTQQLQLPLTIPLMIGFFIAFYCMKSPDGGLVFWGSMIPFTSPIVMLARIPYGVPVWHILLSVALLLVTFFVCAWASAKIYKAGILMFGKKSTFKDLWKWLKQ